MTKIWALKKSGGAISLGVGKTVPTEVSQNLTILGKIEEMPDARFRDCLVEDEVEVIKVDLAQARTKVLNLRRATRDEMLIKNDAMWAEASKRGQDVTDILADAEKLRDMPETAQTELDALTDLDEIWEYDPFAGLELTQSY